jgi:hypothetical protein
MCLVVFNKVSAKCAHWVEGAFKDCWGFKANLFLLFVEKGFANVQGNF